MIKNFRHGCCVRRIAHFCYNEDCFNVLMRCRVNVSSWRGFTKNRRVSVADDIDY